MEAESPSPDGWRVHKFGGTSLADSDRIRHVTSLVAGQSSPTAVVVSAMSGVTDRLLDLADAGPAHDDALHEAMLARD